jgi:hypothetical protein
MRDFLITGGCRIVQMSLTGFSSPSPYTGGDSFTDACFRGAWATFGAEIVAGLRLDERFERTHTFGDSQSREMRDELRRSREWDEITFWKVKPAHWISRDILAGKTIN